MWVRTAFRFQPRIRHANLPRLPLRRLLIGGPLRRPSAVRLAQPRAYFRSAIRPMPLRESRCAMGILMHLARRAYRRQVTSDDIETLFSFYKRARAAGTFDDGIRAALERVLVSPDFLFRIEADPTGVSASTTYRISDVELASRLSFFCGAAFRTTLYSTWQSTGHCMSRRFSSNKSRVCSPTRAARTSLVDNFFSDWLETRNVWLLNPDGYKVPVVR